jgi:putative transcriptional regulator
MRGAATPVALCIVLFITLTHPGRSGADATHTSTPLAKGKFLVAARQLEDPNFAETVVLLLDYGDNGAVGVVINRPTDVTLAKALPDVKGLRHHSERVHLGGPVNRGQILILVNAATAPAQSQTIFGTVHVTGSLETLKQLARAKSPKAQFRAYAGYAGWAPGQLEREYERGDWHVIAADPTTIFETPGKDVWPRLIDRSAGKWVRADLPAERVNGDAAASRAAASPITAADCVSGGTGEPGCCPTLPHGLSDSSKES